MPKFEVIYTVTVEQTYSYMVTAKDSDAAMEKVEDKLGDVSGSKYPGDLTDETIDYSIDEIVETD